MKRSMIALGLVLGLTSPLAASATDLKIGYVDLKSAVENTQRYQQGVKELKLFIKKENKALETLRAKVAQAEKSLLEQSMAMSPDRLSEKQNNIKDMRKSLSRKQQDAQEGFRNKKNRLDQKIFKRFYEVVRKYAKEQHYDMVLPKSSSIYFDASHDVTAAITKQLDADTTKK